MRRWAVWIAALALAGEGGVEFRNVAHQAGLVHAFPNGGSESKQFIIETTGSGAAFIDYDNDGFLDIFLVSGEGGISRLYRNNGKGKFEDVSRKVGITRAGWGQGVCAGDYDNDGFTDLFVAGVNRNLLYRNRGDGSFEDVTVKAGDRKSVV